MGFIETCIKNDIEQIEVYKELGDVERLSMFEERLNLLLEYKEIGGVDDYFYFHLYCRSKEAYDELTSWEIQNQSPYSDSFYNAKNIKWGSKPLGSLRIASHWNFLTGDIPAFSQERGHCPTDIYIENDLALGQWDGERYRILKIYERKKA